jgi:transglutaminase-like putative cysteine protease
MRPTDRSGIAVVVSVMLACLTARPLTSDGSFIPMSWLLVLLIGGLSVALRRARVGSAAVLGAQSALLAVFSVGLSLSSPGVGATWYQQYPLLWAAGIEHMRTQASPMDPNDGVRLIFVTVVGVIMIMTELLVSGVGRPAWALAPPATLFLVPALGLGTDTGVFNFLLIAIGYLAILVAEGLNITARWTRGLSRDTADGFGTAAPVVWRAAGSLAGPAVVLTIVLGFLLPTLLLPGIGFGSGPGSGPLQLTDPTLDLRRNLNQPDDRVVLEYQTEAADGVYLRMASLPRLSSDGWTNVEIQLTPGNQLSDIPGLTAESPELFTTRIQVLDFASQYLPLPYAPRRFSADGEWRFDTNSLVVISADKRPQGLRQLDYTVQSAAIDPDAAELASATVGTPPDDAITAELPEGLPQSIIDLTRQVTKGIVAPAAKAAAIQTFLRSSRFEYSTERLPGSGYQALENFLINDRRGYCEQFASAMAAMARVAGIPSRVSVGFLPGDQQGDSWKVSIRDMHAWPELYFSGYGWVRFEPTPATVTGSAPPWTVLPEENPGEDPSANPSEEATAEPSASAGPSTEPSLEATPTGESTNANWGQTVLMVAGGLVLLLILAAPATIRVRRRTTRLSGEGAAEEQVESAWAEIRDTVLDHGGAWPGGSPRSIGNEVASRLDQEEAASMSRVATLVERSRYAQSFADTEAAEKLPGMTQEIRRGIAAPVSLARRLRAVILPKSLFRRRSPVDGSRSGKRPT